jgi:hypothetical protein
MGFIGKIFGAIFGFIGAILTFPLKLFGVGKKSDFYMEADDASSGSAAPLEATQKAPEPAPAKATAESAAPSTSAAKPDPEPAMASAPATPASNDPVFSKPVEPVTFAPENLLTLKTTGGRRRPGPSLSPFKDMARQVAVR